MQLRAYQQQACDALWDELCQTDNAPLAVLPTGAGKSLVIANLINRMLELGDNSRCVVLTHRKELLMQNRHELASLLKRSEGNFGLFCSALSSKTVRQVTFASVQSVARSAKNLGLQNLVIIDEAHLVPRKTASIYQKIIFALKEVNPRMRIIGVTATPYRLDSGSLTEGKGAIFTNIAFEIGIRQLIDQEYLCPLVSRRSVDSSMDLSDVKVVAGEFDAKGVERSASKIIHPALHECVRYKDARKSWLVFMPSVSLAETAVEELRSVGIRCQLVTGSTPPAERDLYLKQFKAKQIQALVSVDVLTTGFNAPNVDLIALLRPTKSLSLYVQIVGRGTRKAEGKQDCLVLDFGGNIERFGPVDAVEPDKKSTGKKKEAPIKFCPECGLLAPLGALCCTEPTCGYVWPPPTKGEETIQKVASNAAILSEPEVWDVKGVVYRVHMSSKTHIPVVMLEFYIANSKKKATTALCFEHEGFAQIQAIRWWKQNVVCETIPSTSEEAVALLSLHWREPRQVVVIRNKKFYNVTRFIYEDTGQPSAIGHQ